MMCMPPDTVLKSLNQALHHVFSTDARVYLLGEDILDPYGGAFKVSQGLSTNYPQRVLTTPISEAGMIGVAAGMALRGLHPVVEIMFGDFLTLAADQIINHIAKFRWMYNDQVRLPMVIRTPMGGRRSYGPTHSQTLEKLFLGIPGIEILAASSLGDPGEMLANAILQSEDPVLFIENKLLYPLSLFSVRDSGDLELETSSDLYPVYTLRICGAPPPDLTMATYGYMAELALQAQHQLAFEEEIFTEIVVYSKLSPFQIDPLLLSLHKTSRLLTIEEGTLTLGWGAEILARCFEQVGNKIVTASRLAAHEHPIPASKPLEEYALPDTKRIISTVHHLLQRGECS